MVASSSSSSSRQGLAILFLLLLLLQFTSAIAKSFTNPPYHRKRNTEYIKSSCTATTYPRLCYRSLSIYATKINTSPRLLAQSALIITFRASKSTSRLMRKLSKTHGLKPRVALAMADCVELIGDSLDELQKSIGELVRLKRSNFQLIMGDVQTWVSAALTDEDTCMDGFAGKAMNGYVKTMVRKRIVKIAHLTSNALALINNYSSPS
ncbi:hypothetical protein GQ457_16G026470 [Hibiscus cannabinus]